MRCVQKQWELAFVSSLMSRFFSSLYLSGNTNCSALSKSRTFYFGANAFRLNINPWFYQGKVKMPWYIYPMLH